MSYLENAGAWIIGGVGTIYAFVTGNFDVATQVLVGIMLLDVVTGIMKGVQNHNLRSAIMSIGIMKKGGIILSIVFAGMLDLLLNGGSPVFVLMMTWLAIGNEGLSFVENLKTLGVKIPDAVTSKLGQFADEYDEAQEDKEINKDIK